MGLNLPELSLIVSPVSIPKSVSDLLREISMTRDGSEKLSKLDDYVKQLEDEMRKIEAFKRELPLCMLLLKDAIVKLKEEEMLCTESKDRPVMEEFIPLKGNSDEDGIKMGNDCSEKKNWMSTAQLWSTNTNYDSNNKQNPVLELQPRNEEKNGSATENPLFQPCKKRNRDGGFVPFKRNSVFPATVPEEEKEIISVSALSLMPPTAEPGSINMNSKSRGGNRAVSGSSLLTDQTKLQCKPQQQHQQAFRKQRRCWSPELHRRFVNALQQLGGTQVATPKQIRELMQVDGLTNDEVKSHLQKYRLHVRRLPAPSSATANNGSYMGQDQSQDLSKANNSQSNSPQGPLHVAGSAKGISMTGGDSREEEEDEKSDGRSWKSRLHKPGEYDV